MILKIIRLVFIAIVLAFMFFAMEAKNINSLADNDTECDFDYYSYAKNEWQNGNDLKALAALEYVIENDLPDSVACKKLYEKYLLEINERKTAKGRIIAIGKGFVTGNVDGGYSLAGSLLGDVFVYGDIRDLVKETFFEDEKDSFVIAFSSAGIITTLFPPASSSMSLLKALKKTGSLSSSLAGSFEKTFKNIKTSAKESDKLVKIKGELMPVYELWQNSKSFGQFSLIMKNASNAKDLKYVTKLLKEEPKNAAKFEKILALSGSSSQKAFSFVEKSGQKGVDLMYNSLRKGPLITRIIANHPTAFSRLNKNVFKSASVFVEYFKNQFSYALFQYGELFRSVFLGLCAGLLSILILPFKFIRKNAFDDKNGKIKSSFRILEVYAVSAIALFAIVYATYFHLLKNKEDAIPESQESVSGAFSESPWGVFLEMEDDAYLNESFASGIFAFSVIDDNANEYIVCPFKSLGLSWSEIKKGGIYSLSVMARRKSSKKAISFEPGEIFLFENNPNYALILIPDNLKNDLHSLKLLKSNGNKKYIAMSANGEIVSSDLMLMPLGEIYSVSGLSKDECSVFIDDAFAGIAVKGKDKFTLEFLNDAFKRDTLIKIPLTKKADEKYYKDFSQAMASYLKKQQMEK